MKKYSGGYHIVDGNLLGLEGEPIFIDEDWISVDNFTSNSKFKKQLLEICKNNKIIMVVNLPIKIFNGDVEYLTTYCRIVKTHDGRIKIVIPYRYSNKINGITLYLEDYGNDNYGITGEAYL